MLVTNVRMLTDPESMIGTSRTSISDVIKTVDTTLPHLLSLFFMEVVPIWTFSTRKVLNIRPVVIPRHITNITTPKVSAVAVDAFTPIALKAMLAAMISYVTEPMTDNRNHEYGTPMIVDNEISPIIIAIEGTMEKYTEDRITSTILLFSMPHSKAWL